MKYQKIQPDTKPNMVHMPDQKTLTANARVIIQKIIGEEARGNQAPSPAWFE